MAFVIARSGINAILCAEPAELRFEPAQVFVAVSFQNVAADQDDVGMQGVNLVDESIEEAIIRDWPR